MDDDEAAPAPEVATAGYPFDRVSLRSLLRLRLRSFGFLSFLLCLCLLWRSRDDERWRRLPVLSRLRLLLRLRSRLLGLDFFLWSRDLDRLLLRSALPSRLLLSRRPALPLLLRLPESLVERERLRLSRGIVIRE